MQHYFLKNISSNIAEFNDEDIHHILHVMRFKNNDKIVGIFESKKYLINLNIKNDSNVGGEIIEALSSQSNVLNVTLIHGMPKNDKFELALQKATELGANTIVPYLSDRSIIKLEKSDYKKKLERWNKIVKEASEQSERVDVPCVVEPISKNEIGKYLSEVNIVCDENLGRTKGTKLLDFISQNKGKNITIFVGPEGGFSPEEFATFSKLNIVSCGLGKRILRSETAVMYALSIIGAVNEEE